jgi:dTDP-glucose pyrophosphorylase
MRDILPKITIGPDLPIRDAVQTLNRGGYQIVLIADPATQRLLGIVTDYDVRQAILHHIDFERPISEIMHVDPIVGRATMDSAEVESVLKTRNIAQLPLLDETGRVTDIAFDDSFKNLNELTAETIAVVMAGGLGARLRPLTSATPKPLLHVGDQPILFSLLDQILFEGFGRVYVTVNYKSDMIIDAISAQEEYRNRVRFVAEEKALGTAGALSLLPERPMHPFVVLNADLLTNLSFKALLRHHGLDKNAVTMAIKRETTVIPYGVAELEGSRIIAIREKPSHSYFINTGVYVVDPEILDLIPPDTFVDMPDVIARTVAKGRQVGSFPVHEYWLDIGNHEHYVRAREDHELIFNRNKLK